MEQLIAYLYRKNVNTNDPNLEKFSKQQPVKVHGLTEEQLQLYSPALIRNILSYSPANMELRLSLQNILIYIRLNKIKGLMQEDKLEYFFEEWVNNQFMPIKSSTTTRKIPTNSPYIYIDESSEEKKEAEKTKNKNKAENEKKSNNYQMAMLNIQELTKQLQNRFLMKNMEIGAENLKKEEDRTAAKAKVQWKKIEDYIYEKFCQDTLMVFNFVYSCPYIDEKELLARTMLPIVELRKCLNNLVADGLINFYAQTSRSMIFKPLKKERVLEFYRNHIAQTLLNLLVFLQQNPPLSKSTFILNSVAKLDDILMILI